MPHIFGDSMVLQRDMPIPIWGKAKSGEEITVSIHTQTRGVQADKEGNWQVNLDPMVAGGPFELRIEGENTWVFDEILIGEVWLCSGQSNMAFPLRNDFAAKIELDRTDFPQIRLFNRQGSAYPSRIEFSPEQLENLRKENYYLPAQWRSCSASTAEGFSAVAYYFGKALYEELKVPIGLIHNAIGGSSTEGWISEEALLTHPQLRYLVEIPQGKTWLDLEGLHPFLKERATVNLGNWIRQGASWRSHPFQPSYLYNTGIKPLIPFAMRGVIWYQGESNSTNPEMHRVLLPLLINSWRKAWGGNDFPFLFVQLPGMGTSKGYQAERWPEFRETQAEALSLAHTGMAVAIDVGNPTDVHPRNKKTVGERLARIAKAQVYGQSIIYAGPEPSSFELITNQVHIHWRHIEKGLITVDGKSPKELVLRGYSNGGEKEELIHVENARIENDKLILPFPEGFVPYELKYAWAPYPKCNLVNGEGLPAPPFILNLLAE